MIATDGGRAERLAKWIREMSLADQVLITGSTVVLEEISERRPDLPYAFDGAELREAATPAEAVTKARQLARLYADQPEHIGPDGVDEHWRISNLSRVMADRIEAHYPVQED
ncbi:hypothetical protein [Cryobacterium psychrophilum]|uniref:Uncharacterized protein n=1 Tax=Cryobacterium psychrophilum TaxID=41988 RepID=A0A4Y8KJQ1_9MICO|nr:hypothetical protein [Cryobacterium psychrophilum]TDW26910.1 hypothetical protein EDD25_3472 [Cryobacterium psychrophilum]TFD75318.1 hypothetical protein E3T53_16055 [Cryobacterium psychrophilum]